MSKRDVVALVVLAASVLVVGLGCAVTYGLLREYGDVCGDTAAVAQVWTGGAGLAPLVVGAAVVLAVVVAIIGGRLARFLAIGLVVLAVVGATVSGAAGVAGKKAAYADDPATYGDCRGYNSSPPSLPPT